MLKTAALPCHRQRPRTPSAHASSDLFHPECLRMKESSLFCLHFMVLAEHCLLYHKVNIGGQPRSSRISSPGVTGARQKTRLFLPDTYVIQQSVCGSVEAQQAASWVEAINTFQIPAVGALWGFSLVKMAAVAGCALSQMGVLSGILHCFFYYISTTFHLTLL